MGEPKADVIGAAAPGQHTMDDSPIEEHFGPHQALLVKQTMRGCLQECLGCEAKSEFKVAPFDVSQLDDYKVSEAAMSTPDSMYAIEESSFLCRCCWRDGRPFDMRVSSGGEPGGAPIVNFKKPCGMPLWFSIPTGKDGTVDCPCVCFLPKVDMTTPKGEPLGAESKYICDVNLFVPKLQYSEADKPVYIMKPETCLGGCCIACNPCSGKGLLYVPFYFHDAQSMEVINDNRDNSGYNDQAPQIRKLWAGLKRECCTTADTFMVKFPSGIDAKRKAALLGMTFLIDFTVFERQQDTAS